MCVVCHRRSEVVGSSLALLVSLPLLKQNRLRIVGELLGVGRLEHDAPVGTVVVENAAASLPLHLNVGVHVVHGRTHPLLRLVRSKLVSLLALE